jgi:hypothetical protein
MRISLLLVSVFIVSLSCSTTFSATATATEEGQDCATECAHQVAAAVAGNALEQHQILQLEHQLGSEQTKLDSCRRVAASQFDMNQSLELSVVEFQDAIAALQKDANRAVALEASIQALQEELQTAEQATKQVIAKSEADFATARDELHKVEMKAIHDDSEASSVKRDMRALQDRSYINVNKIMGLFGYGTRDM